MEIDFMEASSLIVRPKQPFIEWINRTYPDEVIALETYHDECGPLNFLIPDFEHLSDAQLWLEKNFIVLFEEQVSEWSTDVHAWPENRTYVMFAEWFDISFHLMVFDLREVG